MTDKRETRKDLPKREFDADLNSPMLSNDDDPPVDQRDSDHRGDHKTSRDANHAQAEHADADAEHDVGNADNLAR